MENILQFEERNLSYFCDEVNLIFILPRNDNKADENLTMFRFLPLASSSGPGQYFVTTLSTKE